MKKNWRINIFNVYLRQFLIIIIENIFEKRKLELCGYPPLKEN